MSNKCLLKCEGLELSHVHIACSVCVIVKAVSTAPRWPRIYSGIHSRFQGLCVPKRKEESQRSYSSLELEDQAKSKSCWRTSTAKCLTPVTEAQEVHRSAQAAVQSLLIEWTLLAREFILNVIYIIHRDQKTTLWFRTFFPIKMQIGMYTQNFVYNFREFLDP